ncbi:MAG: dihydroneopterin aldolase [Bacteroidetes bacterium]|nr:dihydroneopterin aldolase [Bacteroidota bacterium]
MTTTIKLINCDFYAHHGVMQEEHRIGGRYQVDVEMTLDAEEAAMTDDITATVDYESVYSTLRHLILSQKKYLIEALAHQMAVELLGRFLKIHSVLIRVRKMNPPVGGVCDYAEIEYRKSRS